MSRNQKISEHISSIAKMDSKNIQDHNLWELFSNGTKAIQLTGDNRIQSLWSKLFESNNSNDFGYFWERDLESFSRNHLNSNLGEGDMIRYLPHNIGHSARKITLTFNKISKNVEVSPKSMQSDSGYDVLDQSTLREAWDLASDIFRLSLPQGVIYPNYSVSLQILRYPSSYKDFKNIFALLKDSFTGRWTNLGIKLDIHKNKILSSSPFDKPLISPIYEYIVELPIFNNVLVLFNKIFFRRYANSSNELEVLGTPHIDGSRAFTMLIGERDSILTEVYHNKQWHEIKLTPSSIHVFPGKLWNKNFGLKPTYHRYSIKKSRQKDNSKKSLNVTLLLGIVESK